MRDMQVLGKGTGQAEGQRFVAPPSASRGVVAGADLPAGSLPLTPTHVVQRP